MRRWWTFDFKVYDCIFCEVHEREIGNIVDDFPHLPEFCCCDDFVVFVVKEVLHNCYSEWADFCPYDIGETVPLCLRGVDDIAFNDGRVDVYYNIVY
jgi:hypothetical protein